MTTRYHFFRTTSLTLAIAIALFTGKAWADGKQLFLDNKCNKCHEGRGIKLLPKTAVSSGDEEEDDAKVTDASGKKIDPPKLEDIKDALVKDQGSLEKAKEFIPLFLTKKAENKDGRKHKKKFNGEPKDLQTIADWLLQ